MLRHLAGTIILILFGISCAEQRSWTEVTFEHDSYIKVPLTINGDVHWYIFDTGAGVSTILSELAVKYNLRNEREEELAEKIADQYRYGTNLRGSAEYRKALAQIYIRRLVDIDLCQCFPGVFPFQRCWCLFVLEKKIFQR